MKTKIQIKSIFGKVLFELEKENNTIKNTLLEAIEQYADLQSANLRYADLRYADLRYAENIPEIAIAQTRILPEGDIIGWKKCNDEVIVRLLIPAKAKRSNAFGRKCRASYVKTLKVIGAKVGVGSYDGAKYIKGKITRANKWDDDFTNECSNGIHFFITRLEAENY